MRDALLVGSVLQEVLSGIRHDLQFDRTRLTLSAFGLVRVTRADIESPAQFYNACQRVGLQGSHTDFLLCAVAQRLRLAILTTDEDFQRYARVFPVRLHEVQ